MWEPVKFTENPRGSHRSLARSRPRRWERRALAREPGTKRGYSNGSKRNGKFVYCSIHRLLLKIFERGAKITLFCRTNREAIRLLSIATVSASNHIYVEEQLFYCCTHRNLSCHRQIFMRPSRLCSRPKSLGSFWIDIRRREISA